MRTRVLACGLAVLGLCLGCGSDDSASDEPGGNSKPSTSAPAGDGMKPGSAPPAGTAAGKTPEDDGTAGSAAPMGNEQAGMPAAGEMTAMGTAGAMATEPEPGPADDETGWQSIISADWELQPNQERYFCQRVTLTEDVYFDAVKAINPLGTHHTALTASDGASQPDGLTECNSSGLLPQGIFGSGVGTEPVEYPAGVGFKLRAGQQLLLNLHVFNVSDKPLKGTSGTAVRITTADKVENVAESLLAGPARFQLPVGRTTVKGSCTTSHDSTLFAVQPHMHQTGVHMKGVAHSSTMGDVTVHDGDFSFENQLVYKIDPVPMKKGDKVDVECTFDNQTDGPLSFGESSTQEMCFLVLHRYPAAENPSVTCVF